MRKCEKLIPKTLRKSFACQQGVREVCRSRDSLFSYFFLENNPSLFTLAPGQEGVFRPQIEGLDHEIRSLGLL